MRIERTLEPLRGWASPGGVAPVRGGHAPVLRVFSAQTERESVPRHPRTPPWGTAPELLDGLGARTRPWQAGATQDVSRRGADATMLARTVLTPEDARPLSAFGRLRPR